MHSIYSDGILVQNLKADCCTLFSDCTLINRRNVKADPKDAYRADRDFFPTG